MSEPTESTPPVETMPTVAEVLERLATCEEQLRSLCGDLPLGQGCTLPRDLAWTCPKCGTLLGMWDPIRSRLRVRIEKVAYFAWVDLPDRAREQGAKYTQPCRRCAELASWPM